MVLYFAIFWRISTYFGKFLEKLAIHDVMLAIAILFAWAGFLF